MLGSQLHLLTYLAQVRQLLFKNVKQCRIVVRIMPRILLIQHSKKYGMSRKEIVIIGTVQDADLAGQSKNTVEWYKVVGSWRKPKNCFLSRSHVEERK